MYLLIHAVLVGGRLEQLVSEDGNRRLAYADPQFGGQRKSFVLSGKECGNRMRTTLSYHIYVEWNVRRATPRLKDPLFYGLCFP